jgi:hypothetical protein
MELIEAMEFEYLLLFKEKLSVSDMEAARKQIWCAWQFHQNKPCWI